MTESEKYIALLEREAGQSRETELWITRHELYKLAKSAEKARLPPRLCKRLRDQRNVAWARGRGVNEAKTPIEKTKVMEMQRLALAIDGVLSQGGCTRTKDERMYSRSQARANRAKLRAERWRQARATPLLDESGVHFRDRIEQEHDDAVAAFKKQQAEEQEKARKRAEERRQRLEAQKKSGFGGLLFPGPLSLVPLAIYGVIGYVLWKNGSKWVTALKTRAATRMDNLPTTGS